MDKGNQAQEGNEAVVLGDIAKPDDGTFDYALITRNNLARPFSFRTDGSGSAWLYWGTDSGFEGTTTLYYTKFQAQFAAVPEPLIFLGICTAVGFGTFFKSQLKSSKLKKKRQKSG